MLQMESRNARLERYRRADRFRYKIYLIRSYGLKVINYLRKHMRAFLLFRIYLVAQINKLIPYLDSAHFSDQDSYITICF